MPPGVNTGHGAARKNLLVTATVLPLNAMPSAPMHLPKVMFRPSCVFVLVALVAFGACLQGAPEPVDPLTGDWLWYKDTPVTFKADGTVHNSNGADGTWQYLHNPQVQRHYRIIWERGKFIDEVVCAEDGQHARVRNQAGVQFDVRRAISDKPAASPTPGKPAG